MAGQTGQASPKGPGCPWTVKYTKAMLHDDRSMPSVDLAIPAFGYKNHVSIDRGFGVIWNMSPTHAAAHAARGSKACWIG